jgi:hypothetical protein
MIKRDKMNEKKDEKNLSFLNFLLGRNNNQYKYAEDWALDIVQNRGTTYNKMNRENLIAVGISLKLEDDYNTKRSEIIFGIYPEEEITIHKSLNSKETYSKIIKTTIFGGQHKLYFPDGFSFIRNIKTKKDTLQDKLSVTYSDFGLNTDYTVLGADTVYPLYAQDKQELAKVNEILKNRFNISSNTITSLLKGETHE